MATILIAEDEKEMQEILVDYMKRNGHTCITADDGLDAALALKNNAVDLAILDIMMPHLDGFSVCKLAREMGNLPILFLTAKSDEEDKLRGYEYGADDYVTKPFSLKLLLAKINALLRRTGNISQDGLRAGGIVLSPLAHRVTVDGNEVELTHKEFELLHLFMQNKNQVFSREQLRVRGKYPDCGYAYQDVAAENEGRRISYRDFDSFGI